MDTLLHPHELGSPLNGSPHSVCLSLPRLADVVAYEKHAPRTWTAFPHGYPRFILHRFVREAAALIDRAQGWTDREAWLTATKASAYALRHYVGDSEAPIITTGLHSAPIFAVALRRDEAVAKRAKGFLQHAGCGVSSRQAEDFLLARGQLNAAHPEEIAYAGSERIIKQQLSRLCHDAPPEDILLTRSGMAATRAVFDAINTEAAPRGRDTWLQLGWLYLDTMELLARLGPVGTRVITLHDVSDADGIRDVFTREGKRLAGVITEVPTNPLLHAVDLSSLRQLCAWHDVPLIIDTSLAGLANVDAWHFADFVVTSLTKYAASEGDVMAGALLLPRHGRYYEPLAPRIREQVVPLYARDQHRLAHQIARMDEIVRQQNLNTRSVATWLQEHPQVDKLWWAGAPDQVARYRAVARGANPWGAVLSFSVKGDLATFHDALAMPKSPSFGTRFTMISPFMYLAHYDLVRTPEGCRQLRAAGLAPDLLRLSCGTEPADAIITALGVGFAALKVGKT